jgi:hypothetical protein
MFLYALARRCGAGMSESAIATGLLAMNPCYLFLSFSFMTEIPFLMLLIVSFVAFAAAKGPGELLWLWAAAALAFIAFLVRPFAAAAITGCAGALFVYDLSPAKFDRQWLKRAAPKLAPFLCALAACAIAWMWLTVLLPQPWSLQFQNERRIDYLFEVSPLTYIRAGLIGPLMYLGIVLSPLALIHLTRKGWRRGTAIAAAIFALTWITVRLAPGLPVTPELSCCGGWINALQLRGLPTRFQWEGAGQWIAIGLGSAGAAGLALAASRAYQRLDRTGAALMLATASYLAATIPLWLFNDRYYLVLVPAGAILLALVPLPKQRSSVAAAIAMAAVMGFASIAGVYDYQRGLAAVVAERDALERSGVPRPAIDAGYSLNGAELYHFVDRPTGPQDSYLQAQGIPMVTSAALDEYTIAAAPIAGTEIVRRFGWPGLPGFSRRELYVLRRVRASSSYRHASARAPTK